ncbi:hypothetical protein BASA81_009308 [Batrachochytrium salamandrivorans]|nr:hypothetical protein BASA81_009308 [Batrachochytrium salamandrivorans]
MDQSKAAAERMEDMFYKRLACLRCCKVNRVCDDAHGAGCGGGVLAPRPGTDRVAEEFSATTCSLFAKPVFRFGGLGVTIFYAYSSYALLVLTSIPSRTIKVGLRMAFARPMPQRQTTTTTTTVGGSLGTYPS